MARIQAVSGAAAIPPYNHVDVMAGQGTLALEFMEQAPGMDAVVVPTSGGGMLAGVALAVKDVDPHCKVFAAEPAGKRLQEALALGDRVPFAETVRGFSGVSPALVGWLYNQHYSHLNQRFWLGSLIAKFGNGR